LSDSRILTALDLHLVLPGETLAASADWLKGC